MSNKNSVSATLEDYLESIFQLVEEKGAARARDIANSLSVHKSTVTATLKSLSKKGLINYSPYETTTLTSQGKKIAKEIASTHSAIQQFLTEILLLKESTAEQNACRMEHAIDKEVLNRLIKFAEFVKDFPGAETAWKKKVKKGKAS